MSEKEFDLRIWDRGPDEFGGEGFQDKDGWVIEVTDPEHESDEPVIEIELFGIEAHRLGLYKMFDGVDMWNRDLTLTRSEFTENYDVPERVLSALSSLPD